MVERRNGESYEDYFVRLHENKEAYCLTHRQIATLLNRTSGHNYGESAYRKEYSAFRRGRLYERKHMPSAEYAHSDGYIHILALSDFHVPYQVPIAARWTCLCSMATSKIAGRARRSRSRIAYPLTMRWCRHESILSSSYAQLHHDRYT